MKAKIYDLIGIGIGPFNLGMAALSHHLSLKTIFFDQLPAFDWHRGLMIEGSTLQVPFMADLVTPVDPTNKFSYLNYLSNEGKLFKFCIKETFYITRTEYNNYCRWVANQLPQLCFSHRVERVIYNTNEQFYEVEVHDLINRSTKTFCTKRIVLGTGTTPSVPSFTKTCTHERVFHSSQYTYRRKYIKPGSTISVVGSGQSAAEIFQDLLRKMEDKDLTLHWITEAERFFPMENSKLTFEHTSPDYLNFFHSLPEEKRNQIVYRQESLYKGINQELIDSIYDELSYQELYSEKSLPVRILPNTKLEALSGDLKNGFDMMLYHKLQEKSYFLHTDYVILSTGYRHQEPTFLQSINHRINRNKSGKIDTASNFSIDKNGNELYVLNAELESHGILTADLGMGPYRNATIINDILGHEYYHMEKRIAFQQFSIPTDIKSHSDTALIDQLTKENIKERV